MLCAKNSGVSGNSCESLLVDSETTLFGAGEIAADVPVTGSRRIANTRCVPRSGSAETGSVVVASYSTR